MQVYELDIVDNHIIAEIEGKRAIIDTGSPMSFGQYPQLQLTDRTFDISDNFMGITARNMSDFVGTDIDFLIGGDVLSKFSFTIEMQKRKITLSTGELTSSGAPMKIDMSMGGPIAELEVNGNLMKIVLDTGAKLSYLHKDITRNCPKVRDEDDFHPMVGRFTTPVYRVPVKFPDTIHDLEFGNLPQLLQMSLDMTGAKGVLGTEIFKFYDIQFNLGDEIIFLTEIQP